MKRLALAAAFAAIAVMYAGDLFAGSIDYLSNQSADYIRTFSRNASTDTDAVHFNPAGTVFMSDGIHLYLSNQYILKNYSSEVKSTGKTYKTDEPTRILPSLFGIYKNNSYAFFAGAGVLAGGGTVNYDDGVPKMVLMAPTLFQSGHLKATLMYYYISAGGAYAISPNLSASATLRYVNSLKKYKGAATYTALGTFNLDAKQKAQGIGGVLGIDYKTDNLLCALRFETPTILNFKTTVNNGADFNGMFEDGKKTRRDLPAMMGLGFSYTLDKLVLTSSLDTFFIGLSNKSDDGYSDDYSSIGYEISLSGEYEIMPKFLKVSAGYMYCKVGGNSDTYDDFDFSLDSHSFGIGGRITPVENFDIAFGIARIHYIPADGQSNTTRYKKEVWNFALGLEYKI